MKLWGDAYPKSYEFMKLKNEFFTDKAQKQYSRGQNFHFEMFQCPRQYFNCLWSYTYIYILYEGYMIHTKYFDIDQKTLQATIRYHLLNNDKENWNWYRQMIGLLGDVK